MEQDNIVRFQRPDEPSEDALTDVLRHGARTLLAQAIEAEVATFLASHADLVDEGGRRRLVRNGFLPERTIQTGIGAVSVRQPRVRDRGIAVPHAKIRFTSSILPPYLRRSRALDELIPWLYLKGVSTGDFTDALAALVGRTPGPAARTVVRLTQQWSRVRRVESPRPLRETVRVRLGRRRPLQYPPGNEESAVHVGLDGRHGRGPEGAGRRGRRLPRERAVLVRAARGPEDRGLALDPKLAVGDGALGFWKALRKVLEQLASNAAGFTRRPTSWTSCPSACKPRPRNIHAIWMAETRKAADAAFDAFLETYQAKYPRRPAWPRIARAARLLRLPGRALEAPANDQPHREHVRHGPPAATAAPRAAARRAGLTMVFRLCLSAQRRWRRLDGPSRLGEVVRGVRFVDGEQHIQDAA